MKRPRHQSGHVFHQGGFWYVGYYHNVMNAQGEIERQKKCRKLVAHHGQYRSKRAVRTLADEILRPINDGTCTAESTMTVTDFIEKYYLPYVEEQKRFDVSRLSKRMVPVPESPNAPGATRFQDLRR